jgi:hypothetical protein
MPWAGTATIEAAATQSLQPVASGTAKSSPASRRKSKEGNLFASKQMKSAKQLTWISAAIACAVALMNRNAPCALQVSARSCLDKENNP